MAVLAQPKQAQQNERRFYNLVTITHTVSDHHLHHGWWWLAAFIPHDFTKVNIDAPQTKNMFILERSANKHRYLLPVGIVNQNNRPLHDWPPRVISENTNRKWWKFMSNQRKKKWGNHSPALNAEGEKFLNQVWTNLHSPSTWLTVGGSRRAGSGIWMMMFWSSNAWEASYSMFT